jgi:hypothetical protein
MPDVHPVKTADSDGCAVFQIFFLSTKIASLFFMRNFIEMVYILSLRREKEKPIICDFIYFAFCFYTTYEAHTGLSKSKKTLR